jgi:hypothetical protein
VTSDGVDRAAVSFGAGSLTGSVEEEPFVDEHADEARASDNRTERRIRIRSAWSRSSAAADR